MVCNSQLREKASKKSSSSGCTVTCIGDMGYSFAALLLLPSLGILELQTPLTPIISATQANMSTSRTQLPREIAYLTDAAHLLRLSAPATAARLVRVRHELLLHVPGAANAAAQQLLSDVQRQQVCTACGHILIPGCGGDALHIKPSGAGSRRRKHRAAIAAGSDTGPATAKLGAVDMEEWGITKVFTCGRCRSVTKVRVPAPARITRVKDKTRNAPAQTEPAYLSLGPTTTPALSSSRPQHPSGEPKPSANAASKQRKKSRKAGLQALLAGQKTSASTKSFTLADFRK